METANFCDTMFGAGNSSCLADSLTATGEEASGQCRRVIVSASLLHKGANEIMLKCTSDAMNAWMLGMENGHDDPLSYLSTDRGHTWRNRQMGASGVLRGEYLIRLRTFDSRTERQPPPAIVYGNPDHARVRELRKLIPQQIRTMRGGWRRLLAVRRSVARAWAH